MLGLCAGFAITADGSEVGILDQRFRDQALFGISGFFGALSTMYLRRASRSALRSPCAPSICVSSW
eukprot:235976-Alexandrium_andersonii.AAC.1